jgi:hypothetical protein
LVANRLSITKIVLRGKIDFCEALLRMSRMPTNMGFEQGANQINTKMKLFVLGLFFSPTNM